MSTVHLDPEKRGKKGGFADVIASHDGVQAYLDDFIFEAGVRAEELLLEARASAEYTGTGDAEIDIEEGRIDRYLVLSDERGQKAALSIEYGRQPYEDEETGELKGGMEGLFILHRALRMSKPKGKAVKM